jgi:lipopolysaccharide/colanic/teichoic acid biosynthesis glycosyltransferase
MNKNQKKSIKLFLLHTLKRLFDLTLSFTILLLLFPIFILCALLIFAFEGSPITYTSKRLCSKEKVVNIYKFRTMVKEANHPSFKLRERFMRDGFLDIPLNCEVYTPIGRILERTQIVELLQIFNIIKNDMSFVGNRPLPLDNIELLKKYPDWERRFHSPAGICGVSQIVGKFNLNSSDRLYLESIYSSVYTNPKGNILLCDLIIIFHTARLILAGKYLDFDKAVGLMLRCGGNYIKRSK